MKKRLLIILLSLVAFIGSIAQGYGSDKSIFEMSLDELLNAQVSIASIKSKPIREQAGIITVITSSEISDSGARDLEDILMQVPGFSTGLDVTGVTGIGLRGYWAYLGQFVIIIDGMEMVDSLFGVFPTGNHIPAEQIERIEIIRGPGSAMYGGNAELAVIKVTTKGTSTEGTTLNMSFGTSAGEFSQRYSANYGKRLKDGHFHYGASLDKNYRSDRNFRGYDGTVFDMADNSDMETLLLNLGLDYKGLVFNCFYDSYHLDDRTFYGEPRTAIFAMNFDAFTADLHYNWQLLDWITITPKITFNHQKPWNMTGDSLIGFMIGDQYKISSERIAYSIAAVCDISESSSLLVGAERYDEKAEAVDTDYGSNLHFEDKTTDQVNYDSIAFFTQYEVDTDLANLTVGGRYQEHSYAGDSFVPRFGITKVWDKTHAKLLYSESFRTPQIEMINYAEGGPITPEESSSYEIELGQRVSEKISLVGNLFSVSVKDILVFDTFESVDTYVNSEEVANYGMEAEARFHYNWGSALIGYSYYRTDHNSVPLYDTGDDNLLVAMPAHKLTFNTTYRLTEQISINANGHYLSKRLGYTADTVGESIETFDPVLIANLFAQRKSGRYTLGIGVKDLFNERYVYIQPSNSYMPPMPDKSREYFINLSIDI